MSKTRSRLEDAIPLHRPQTKKRRIRHALLKQQWERELTFFPQPDPPIYKPLG